MENAVCDDYMYAFFKFQITKIKFLNSLILKEPKNFGVAFT